MTAFELHSALITRLQDRGQSAASFRAACRRAAAALELEYTVHQGHYYFTSTALDIQFEAFRFEEGTVAVIEANTEDN